MRRTIKKSGFAVAVVMLTVLDASSPPAQELLERLANENPIEQRQATTVVESPVDPTATADPEQERRLRIERMLSVVPKSGDLEGAADVLIASDESVTVQAKARLTGYGPAGRMFANGVSSVMRSLGRWTVDAELDYRAEGNARSGREDVVVVRARDGSTAGEAAVSGVEPVFIEIPKLALRAEQAGTIVSSAMPVRVTVGDEEQILETGQIGFFLKSKLRVGIDSSAAYVDSTNVQVEGAPYALRLRIWSDEDYVPE